MTSPSHDALTACWCLWGKAKRPEGCPGSEWHPLICHMIDVMSVADVLWERISPAARAVLCQAFDSEDGARRWTKLLIALHDLGKATPGFQHKWPGAPALLVGTGLVLEKEQLHHGITGTALLAQFLVSPGVPGVPTLPPKVARGLARAVASHHGEFVPTMLDKTYATSLEKGPWKEVREDLVRVIASLIASEESPLPPWALPEDAPYPPPGLIITLAGLACVADWIGSDANVFQYEPIPVDPSEYSVRASDKARDRVEAAGFQSWDARAPREFEELFPFPPRSLQNATSSLLESIDKPSIILIESTMGDGKTEAALLVAEKLAPRLGQRGLFIGLPTQATSNQMLRRVEEFLTRNARGTTNLILTHGDAALSDRFQQLKQRVNSEAGTALRLDEIYDESEGPPDSAHVVAGTWFCQNKRALIAQNAVGTVDQGLLGTLRVKHGFVRLFGLAGKTVVLDEVHAYDTYTSEILDRLVAWLSALNATVVILSATLPQVRRRALLEAFGAQPPLEEAPYPRITAGVSGKVATSVPTTPSRPEQQIQLRHLDDDVQSVARQIFEATRPGGCVAWICNTVKRAQEAFTALRELNAASDEPIDIYLLHSRFLRIDRQEREKLAERLFGPQDVAPKRPPRAVMIGTQVLEQSLDLDFDLMVTDIAPIDLLLQRAGRLHRHNRARPNAFDSPSLWVLMPPLHDGLPSFRSIASVYDEDVLLRTWEPLRRTKAITIPREIETWIERVYGEKQDPFDDASLHAHLQEIAERAKKRREKDWEQAQASLFFAPSEAESSDAFGSLGSLVEEDESGNLHPTLRAQTRLGDETADIICLWQTPDGRLWFDREGTHSAPLSPATFQDTRRLLEHGLKLDASWLRRLGAQVSQPEEWKANPSLRFKWLLRLEEGQGPATIDPELGFFLLSTP